MMKITDRIHAGMRIITITGPAGCGKTTKANELKKKLESQGKKVKINDDDDPSTPAGLKAAGIDVLIITKIN